MTPAQARAFHAVAVEGSFTAAAKLLNLSQATLTHQVKLIKIRYKVELLHRTSRGARLTATGADLLAIVRKDVLGLRRGRGLPRRGARHAARASAGRLVRAL